MTTDDLERDFWAEFSQEFIGDVLRLIASECKNSTQECFTFYPREEGSDLLGGVRRAKVESKARELVQAYPGVLAAPKSSHKTGRGNYHTEIKRGNCVLTIHKVQHKGTPVRKAVYRESYAHITVANLFGEEAPAPDGNILYAQLKYGIDGRMPQALTFAVVAFPDKTGKIVHSIDLLALERYKGIPNEFVSLKTQEEIDDNLNLNLRPDAKRQARDTDDLDNAAEN